MNKVKLFFGVAALMLVTAGVFAGKANHKKTVTEVKYYNSSTSSYVILESVLVDNPTTQATIAGFPLYDNDESTPIGF